jgi:hypothetical protein
MVTSPGYNISSDDGGGLTGPGDQINTDRFWSVAESRWTNAHACPFTRQPCD